MVKPYTTLFLLMSLDGKISPGDSDVLDVDKSFKTIKGLKEGLQQYYDIEQRTDLHSLNSGRVFEKIGLNKKKEKPQKTPVSFIVIDNKPHLNNVGITYLANKSKTLYVATTNSKHPAFKLVDKFPNIKIIKYQKKINLADLLKKLKQKYNIDRITIQSGGTMNASFVREGLIDRVLVVIAPALIGGKNTSTLIDGDSFRTQKELRKIKTLNLINVVQLKNSYISLEYKVNN